MKLMVMQSGSMIISALMQRGLPKSYRHLMKWIYHLDDLNQLLMLDADLYLACSISLHYAVMTSARYIIFMKRLKLTLYADIGYK